MHRNPTAASIHLARAADEHLTVEPRACGEHVLGPATVDLDRAERIRDDMCDAHRRGEMEHSIAVAHKGVDQRVVEDGPFDNAYAVTLGVAPDIAAASGGEIVEDGHRIAMLDQAIDEMATDETGAACHQRPHVVAP